MAHASVLKPKHLWAMLVDRAGLTEAEIEALL